MQVGCNAVKAMVSVSADFFTLTSMRVVCGSLPAAQGQCGRSGASNGW
jgi:hypothetical protein